MTKGSLSVEDIVIFNLADHFEDENLEKGVVKALKDFNASVYDFKGVNALEQTLPKGCYLPYASIKTKDVQFQFSFEFKLDRIKKANIRGNYLMVFSFLIFASIALLYIPFFLFNEDITNQQNLNQGLENQLYILQRDLPISNGYTPEQIVFNQIYENLSEAEKSYEPYLTDLIDKLNPEVNIVSFNANSSNENIIITVTGTTRFDIDEYILTIYEAYGTSEYITDDQRWIVSLPEIKVLSEFVLEVTLYHA